MRTRIGRASTSSYPRRSARPPTPSATAPPGRRQRPRFWHRSKNSFCARAARVPLRKRRTNSRRRALTRYRTRFGRRSLAATALGATGSTAKTATARASSGTTTAASAPAVAVTAAATAASANWTNPSANAAKRRTRNSTAKRFCSAASPRFSTETSSPSARCPTASRSRLIWGAPKRAQNGSTVQSPRRSSRRRSRRSSRPRATPLRRRCRGPSKRRSAASKQRRGPRRRAATSTFSRASWSSGPR
mmetsp:Transcript_26795/g.90231  ORF Transcript_26795/g.90231 Transcript_26795/m.90231 type:complete len:247 (-) Transcript_26795:309-1049(-)